jgi:hypothetical protein
MKSVLAAICELNGAPLIMHVLGVSGTIKGVRRFFQEKENRNRESNKSGKNNFIFGNDVTVPDGFNMKNP